MVKLKSHLKKVVPSKLHKGSGTQLGLKDRPKRQTLVFIAAFAVIGIGLLIASRAASPSASLEPEGSQNITTPAIPGSDVSASGGAYVQFKAASGGTRTTNCVAAPSACGFADETNTGILAGATLTKVPSQATSGSGWTYSGGSIKITGNVGSATTGLEADDGVTVDIIGSNLVVQNLKIVGAHGTSTDAVTIGASTNNVTVDHCDVQGATPAAGQQSPTRGWDGVRVNGGAANISVRHCNIHGFIGGFFPEYAKGNSSFIGNYVHQLTCWNTYDNNSNCSAGAAKGGDHCNAWGDSNGVAPGDTTSTMLLQDNTLYSDNDGCASGSVSFFNDSFSSGHLNAHIAVNHNLLGSAGYYVFSTDEDASKQFSYMGITNNAFVSMKGSQPAIFRDVTGFSWPIGPAGNANKNYNCGNYWDEAAFRGTSADTQPNYNNANWYSNVNSHYEAIVKCPSTLPWTPPPGWKAY